MTVATAPVFPSSRVLAGWWKDLAAWEPERLWVGHLLLHRLEAQVDVAKASPLDPVSGFVLETLALQSESSLEALASTLLLPRPFLQRMLEQLNQCSLIRRGEPPQTWRVTEHGTDAMHQGSFVKTQRERRIFHFLQSDQPGNPACFLSVRFAPPFPAAPDHTQAWREVLSALHDCTRQPDTWKEQHQFPLEVREVHFGEDETLPIEEAWQQIAVDQALRLPVVLMEKPAAAGSQLIGLTYQAERWQLQGSDAVFQLGPTWQQVLPEIAADPPLEDWRKAWQEWCRPRSIPINEVQASVLTRAGFRLRVAVPARLVERLQASRSDAVRNEAWVFAGAGRFRAAALLEIVSTRQES